MDPSSSALGIYSTLGIQTANNEKKDPKEIFFAILKTQLDNRIGQNIFVALWTAILRDCEILQLTDEGNNTFRLTLESSYIGESSSSGEITLIEKEIIIQCVPDNYEIVYPKAKALYEANTNIDPENKELNAIWGWKAYGGYIYTGVGYSILWDANQNRLINKNINDASYWLQSFASPIVKTLQETIQEWNDRGRKPR